MTGTATGSSPGPRRPGWAGSSPLGRPSRISKKPSRLPKNTPPFMCPWAFIPMRSRIFPTAIMTLCAGWPGRRKLSAFGEIGLDFYRNHSPREVQLTRFRELVRLGRGPQTAHRHSRPGCPRGDPSHTGRGEERVLERRFPLFLRRLRHGPEGHRDGILSLHPRNRDLQEIRGPAGSGQACSHWKRSCSRRTAPTLPPSRTGGRGTSRPLCGGRRKRWRSSKG